MAKRKTETINRMQCTLIGEGCVPDKHGLKSVYFLYHVPSGQTYFSNCGQLVLFPVPVADNYLEAAYFVERHENSTAQFFTRLS